MPLKPSWMLSLQANRLYAMCAVLAGFNLILQIVLLLDLIISDPSPHYEIGLVTFWIVFTIGAVFVLSQFYLWFSMLWFLLIIDSPFRFESFFWLTLLIFTAWFGAAIYYFVRYRDCYRRFHQRLSAEAPRAARLS